MNDSYFSRARRVIGAGLDTAIGAAERASGDSLMRQSIREVEDAIAELQRRQDAAHTRSARAAVRHGAAIDRAAALGEQAAYALGAGRDDLARRAVAEQMMAEQAAVAADLEAREAISEAGQTDASIVELEARRDRLAEAFRTGQALSGAVGSPMPADVGRKVARAEAAFDRAAAAKDMSASSGAVLAEIEAVRQEVELARRLAELREGLTPPAQAKPKRRKPG